MYLRGLLTHRFGAQFLNKMESPGQPPASGKPDPGFLLPCLHDGHWPWVGCHHRGVQPSSPQMWAWLAFLQSKGSKQRGTWQMKNVLPKQGSSHFSKIPRLLTSFAFGGRSRVSRLARNGNSRKWYFKNCPWQDKKLVTLCWSLKLREKEN